MSERLHIGAPYLEDADGASRLCAELELRGQAETMWFSVDEKYGPYLVEDRADALVVGLLTTAMKDGPDIVCEAPVSRRLLYQLRHYLIPILAANLPGYHAIELRAKPTDVKLPCAGAVATGWTGGVDSMFTLMKTIHAEEPSRKLTHLMIASNGALEAEDNSTLLKALVRKAENGIAAELGLSVIGIETNLQELVSEVFISVVVYRHAAVILALQKLFSVYYNSGSYAFSQFKFDAEDSGFSELAVIPFFETGNTVFYSAYGAYSRLEKLRGLMDFPQARKGLHPCIHPLPDYNCGRCGKCQRILTALYALDGLDCFSSVFDVNEFERNRDWYLERLWANREKMISRDTLALLKRRGIEISDEIKRRDRIKRTATKMVQRDKEWFSAKLNSEQNPGGSSRIGKAENSG